METARAWMVSGGLASRVLSRSMATGVAFAAETDATGKAALVFPHCREGRMSRRSNSLVPSTKPVTPSKQKTKKDATAGSYNLRTCRCTRETKKARPRATAREVRPCVIKAPILVAAKTGCILYAVGLPQPAVSQGKRSYHTRRSRHGTCPCDGRTPASRGRARCLSQQASPRQPSRFPRSPLRPRSRCAPRREGRTCRRGPAAVVVVNFLQGSVHRIICALRGGDPREE